MFKIYSARHDFGDDPQWQGNRHSIDDCPVAALQLTNLLKDVLPLDSTPPFDGKGVPGSRKILGSMSMGGCDAITES